MARLAPYVREEPCDLTVGAGDYGNAFNNMSLHTFTADVLPAADAEFWSREFSAPPDDEEVIGRLIDAPNAITGDR